MTESYHGYSVDDEDQPQSGGDDMADDRGLDDPLDEGYSPPEKWSAGQRFGNTPREELIGESLDQRLAQEEPEPDAGTPPPDEAAEGREVGDARSGRLVAPDRGVGEDEEKDEVGEDVGIDGAAASAEEAAVHEIGPDDPDRAPG